MRIASRISGILVAAVLPIAAYAGDCVQGQWRVANYQYLRDGSIVEGRALSDRHCLADDVIMDEFRSLDAQGAIIFRGVSFQVQRNDEVSILWAMIGDPGHTSIRGYFNDDGSLETTGVGEDAIGAFEEQFVMKFHDDGLSYDMEMGRNYAQWGVWIMPFNRIQAIYSTTEVNGLEKIAKPRIASAAGIVNAEEQYIILDGWALASVARNDDDVSIRFSSRYENPDRWRTLTWSGKTGDVTASEYSLENIE